MERISEATYRESDLSLDDFPGRYNRTKTPPIQFDSELDLDLPHSLAAAISAPSRASHRSSVYRINWRTYARTMCAGTVATSIVIFGVFSIFWGALWKMPAHPLAGWVIDSDGGPVGEAVTAALLGASVPAIKWVARPDLVGQDVGALVHAEKTWVAVFHPTFNLFLLVNSNASAAMLQPDNDAATAITVYAVEARSENAFRLLIRPTTQALLESISAEIATQNVQRLSTETLSSLATAAPQVITRPVWYNIVNLAPFDVPVAVAITFVGLIFTTILAFFIVMIGVSARTLSNIEKRISTPRLLVLRLGSIFLAYFFLSLFLSLLSLAFQVNFNRTFGRAGFLVFWMLNYTGMLAVGLILEALVPLLTSRFLPFFLIFWVIANVAVCTQPIDVFPHFFRYGYAMPYYNISGAARTILFGTKNNLPLHFGILIAWVALSIVLLVACQLIQRRRS
ncbi:hypothetical protein CYLTODRAFT_342742 [Cylindrobasidium torrendii FP15055 ss-10]|uniref:DUF3533 domain-containing protein n=1 Tax=Cylindrobasidium torrendii FP15055 ss-10 TaxID=1314674 RepID=A0A0D7BSA0_9AGAR|nr:hypothetical protein CYLTODRAFT_342742 [Cylindrobasidium torrendii FP15055 ss-10]